MNISRQKSLSDRKGDKYEQINQKNDDYRMLHCLRDHPAHGFPHDSECGKYFLTNAYSCIIMWYFMRLAVRRDLRHFNPIFIVNLYRDATGSYVACDDV